MYANYSVDVYNRVPSVKTNGMVVLGVLSYVETIYVDIQPYSTALLLAQYGYNIECNKRIFLDYDTNIKIGTQLYYTNLQGIVEKYEVKTLINWDYLELACLEVN
jgi:hypothetical protein